MSEVRYKLHPISALINFLKGLKELILPFVIIFGANLFRGGGIGGMFSEGWQGLLPLIIGGVVLLFMLIAGIIKWKRFVYWFEDGELRIEYGLFIKKKRYIPFERIQSLNYTEGIFHRPFGLVKVKVETAGSGKAGQAEAELTAIYRAEADRIEQEMHMAKRGYQQQAVVEDESALYGPVQAAVPAQPEEEIETRILYRMSLKELLMLATTSGGIGVVISGVALFLSQFAELIPYDAIYDEVMIFMRFGYLVVALTVFAGLLLAWIISVAMTLIAYYQFTIHADDERIYITRGLLEKKKVSVPFKRVQGIKMTQNPLRQLFGYVAVTVESAGGTLADKDEKIRLFPLVKQRAMKPVLEELFPEFDWSPELERLPKRSRPFFYRLSIAWLIPAFAALGYFFYPYGLWALVAVPVIILMGLWQHRSAGYATTGRQLTAQFRGVSLYRYYMMKKRIQVIAVTRTIFQRRRDVASVHATIKSGMLGATALIPHLARENAEDILAWYEPSGQRQTDPDDEHMKNPQPNEIG
ncbi:PH domain-containing protein [Planococcus sp. ISL-109]|uniref:PH domain-containing protein n=1 Tax=Planococcus sp. ISL-109 TaxID=2819166 RepID=UPI001BE4EB73|nr:PH domain-containing protein [Planococcus sp. ISL-109]MBT2582921.1 PH domain-containing protein [Planococcus sp. ISL-109]